MRLSMPRMSSPHCFGAAKFASHCTAVIVVRGVFFLASVRHRSTSINASTMLPMYVQAVIQAFDSFDKDLCARQEQVKIK